MTQKQIIGKREEYIIKVGPLMIKVLKEQMESLREVTYDCYDGSYYIAGEIVAKKFLGMV